MEFINKSGVIRLVMLWCAAVVPAYGQTVEWSSYASDVAGSKYLPLEQINQRTVSGLAITWRQPVIPDAIRDGSTVRGPVAAQNTPLMAGGLLYVSTGLGTVAALDPSTGDVVWNDDVPVFSGNDSNRRARQTRGVAALTQFWGGVGGKKFRAYDKQTGDVVWEIALPGGTSGAPMTYMYQGRQYIVVAVGWEDMASEWIALALPE
jgi:glucose dehydrogenase